MGQGEAGGLEQVKKTVGKKVWMVNWGLPESRKSPNLKRKEMI